MGGDFANWTTVAHRGRGRDATGRGGGRDGRLPGRNGGRGGRNQENAGRGNSKADEKNKKKEKKLETIPSPVYNDEDSSTFIKLLSQSPEIPVTLSDFGMATRYVRSSMILNLAVTRGRNYIPGPNRNRVNLPSRRETARYMQYFGDDSLLALINDHDKLSVAMVTMLRDPFKHPNEWSPPGQFTGIIPAKVLATWASDKSNEDTKFDAGMKILQYYLCHCYGEGQEVQSFLDTLWDEIQDQATLDSYITKSGKFRNRIIREKTLKWSPVWIPDIDFLPLMTEKLPAGKSALRSKSNSALQTSESTQLNDQFDSSTNTNFDPLQEDQETSLLLPPGQQKMTSFIVSKKLDTIQYNLRN